MKQSLKTLFPAFIVIMASIVLLGSYYLRIPVMHLGFIQGFHVKGNRILLKMVNLSGDGAIVLGAASFSWFIFKKKLKSSPKLIKETGKKVYNLHAYFGWAALALVVLHGGYYIMVDTSNSNNLTGLASFLILVSIAVYGFLIKRTKMKSIKKVHFMLTAAWLITLFIHGNGLVMLSCVGLVGLYILLSILKSEQRVKVAKPEKKATAI